MRKPLRVLLVEDASDDAELIVHALELGGYAVDYERVQTAAALHAALTRTAWDLVLSDYSMPSFSAQAALEILKRTGLDLPFVIVSGTIDEETAVAALQAGAHDFLVKDRLARLVPAVERELRDVAVRRDRRRAEDALRESEADHRSLIEHAVFGIYQASLADRFLAVNPALVTMLGYDSVEELLQVRPSKIYADTTARADLERRCLEHGHVAGAEMLWTRKAGDEIRVRLHGRLRADRQDGRGPVLQVFVEDVTEQHRLQQQLRQAQKMEAIGQLAGGVAHDFNNMLTAILGYAELLTEQLRPDMPIGRDLHEICSAAKRAAALTHQLLAFSRKQVLALEPVDLSRVVQHLEPMLRRLIGAPIKIDTPLAANLAPVLADVTQLEHLLINLSVNARDAMPHGGVLTIATGSVTLDEEFGATHAGAEPGSYARLSVADTGIGMTPDVRQRIFEPFFTTKGLGKGTGLGLAAVYGTVKQLGGYVDVESEPGRGTTFTIYLPATVRPIGEPLASATSPKAPPVGRETVLLVEDEPSVRTFTATALRRFGYHIVEADSAETALQLLQGSDHPVHLLLTDVVLPGLNGHQLAVRVTTDRPHVRVLFMSGYAATLATIDGFLMPGMQLLEKPFTAHALLAKIRHVLGTPIESLTL